jgi:hypothetical protein
LSSLPLTNICPVNEAKQVQKRNSRDEEQVQLPAKSGLGLGVELDEGLAEPAPVSQHLQKNN